MPHWPSWDTSNPEAGPVGKAGSALHLGLVLHRRAYSETSLILELFTREGGRRAVLAKGVRGDGRQRLLTEPLQPLQLGWRGKGELPTLVHSEAWQDWTVCRPAGTAALAGMYLNELLLALLPRDDPHPGLFDGYLDAVRDLLIGPPAAPTLRRFEWALLTELGYAPDLQHDGAGAAVLPTEQYEFDLTRGGVMPVAQGGWSGRMLLALAAGEMDAGSGQRRFLRRLIEGVLDGRPLRSFDLLARIEQVLPNTPPRTLPTP